MIDGAFAKQAGAALGVLAHHAGKRSGGAGSGIVGGAEDGDGGNAERRGHVHRSGIVSQNQTAGGGQIDEFAKAGLARQIADVLAGLPQMVRHGLTQRALGGGTENQKCYFPRQQRRAFREALREPSLGIAIRRARADARHRRADSQRAQVPGTRIARRRNSVEPDGVALGEALHHAGAPQQFEIVEALMPRNIARFGHRDRLR